MTTIIDGSAGITFPNGSNAQAAPSKVLQVIQTSYGTSTSIATTTPTTISGLATSITPLFSTSKILVQVNLQVSNPTTTGVYFLLYRGATQLGGQPFAWVYQNGATGNNDTSMMTMFNYLDSPATTSSTTYSVYWANAGSGTSYLNRVIGGGSNEQGISSVTLMEIAQ